MPLVAASEVPLARPLTVVLLVPVPVPPLRVLLLVEELLRVLVLPVERLAEELLRVLVLPVERVEEAELLRVLVLPVERVEDAELLRVLVLPVERLAEELLRDEDDELLMVPPTARDVDEELRLTPDEELREELEELRDELDEDEEREELWVEEPDLVLLPLRDWALTGAMVSAVAATAASANLNIVFIMLNFSFVKITLFSNACFAYIVPKSFFASESWIDTRRQKRRNRHCGKAADHHQGKEPNIAEAFLEHTGKEPRYHHAECHECSADGIMRCAVFPLRKIHHVKHIGGKTESVSELVERNKNVNEGNGRRLGDSHV